MTPISKSLLSKIQEILDNKQKTEQAEQVAKDYVQLSEQINNRIKHFIKLIRDGNYYAALDIARLDPPLTTQIERIRFPREREWLQFLKDSGLPTFEGFNDNEFKKVKEICADSSYRQPKGYRDYRKAILLKDKNTAIQCLRKLCEDYPKDHNAKQELMRLESEVFEEIDGRLSLLLKREKTQAIVEEVKNVREQPWLIQLTSDAWEACLRLYNQHTQKQHTDEVLQSLSQLKVIRRVGDWKDGRKHIEKLTSLKTTDAYRELEPQLQAETEDMLQWFRDYETEEREQNRLRKELKQFLSRLEPLALEESIRELSLRDIKHLRKELHQEWLMFQDKLPQEAENAVYQYDRADSMLNHALGADREKRGLPIWILIAISSIVLLTIGFFLVNRKEAKIAGAVTSPFHRENLPATEVAMKEWDRFTDRFFSNYNPFRNYGAHSRIEDIKRWIQDAHTRQNKLIDLLNKIRSELEQSPDAGQLKRIRLNMEIVKDLYEKLPKTGNSETLDTIDSLSMRVNAVHRQQITKIREEIVSKLVDLETLIYTYFPNRKSDFQNVRAELIEVKALIDELQTRFRLSPDETEFSNLRQRFEEDIAVIDRFEQTFEQLLALSDVLIDCTSLSAFQETLERIAALPFPRHPMIVQAHAVLRSREKFESPIQQLLSPGNPIAWEKYIHSKDNNPPLIPRLSNPRETRIFESLINEYALKSIYNYRVVQYQDRERIDDHQRIHTLGVAENRSDSSQASGRLVQTVDQFDETVFAKEQPFVEKVYMCRIDASGKPLEGEVLELEELCPESEFYRELTSLCQFDPTLKRFGRSLLRVIDEIKRNTKISPIFKAYITQELFDILMVRPYDWGLNFSPTVQLEYRDLTKFKGVLTPYDWLRSSSRARLLEPLTIFYENISTGSYHAQALLGHELFDEIVSQRMLYGGVVDAHGDYHILNSTPDDHRLYGLLENGTFGVLRKPSSPASPTNYERAEKFTPLLYMEDTRDEILDRVTEKTGTDLRDEKHIRFLPDFFL